MISVSERGLTSTQWSVYNEATKRTQYSTVPTSSITAEAVTVDGFALLQKDTAGITTTASRQYTASGIIHMQTDGRGNATTTVTDIAGRALTVTDAAGNVTTTAYDTAHDEPAMITDAMGNTTCYRYDERGRKVAEWGTSVQPACFGYDDADYLVSLKTFRAGAETISTDPSERPDGDVTTWEFDAATGLELRKTYADNTAVVKTYDAHNRLATETNARGRVKVHSYEHARGLLLNTTWYYPAEEGEEAVADSYSPSRSFAYNHLGQLTQVVDAAGTRTIGYNQYGEQETDSLVVDNDTHLITETRDALGRSTGYLYSKNGATQQTVTTGYGTDGRIASAGFLHGGAEKLFSYEYLPGTHLLQKLTLPSNMTLTQSYEPQRNLLTGMAYHRGTTLVAQREYVYDTLGRPTARNTARKGTVVNDTFTHNTRSELTAAQVNGEDYQYNYDNIGNRTTATEGDESTAYTANALNQYTDIQENEEAAFSPLFDADGNQTRIKTETGIWEVIYNAENRPVSFTNAESNTMVECAYDSMGRRAYKKVTSNGTVTLHQRYIYRGYLQIAALDLTRSNHPALWFITWDPTQPIATRPLSIRINGTWFTYGWDLTKTICELYGSNGYIRTAYSYTPYGEVTESANGVYQPIQWSSELFDDELSLTYYNYRYYNHLSSCWLTRDLVERENPYISFNIFEIDMLGLDTVNVNVLVTYYVDAIDIYFYNNVYYSSGVFILEELMLQQSFNYNCKENVTIYNYETKREVIHEGGRESIGNLFYAVKTTGSYELEYVENAFKNSIKKYDEARHISVNANINDINNNNNGYNIRISGSAKATFTIAANSGFQSWLDGVLRDKFYIYDYFRAFTDLMKATSNLYKAPDIQEIEFHADYKVCCEDGKLKIINMYDTTSASKSIHAVTKVKGSGTALLEAAVSVN